MAFMRNYKVPWLAAALFGTLATQAQAQIIVNGGFESGLTGWTKTDQPGSDGAFVAQSGTVSPLNGFSVSAPPEGIRAAMTDSAAGGSHVLYQDFTVPAGISSASIQFSLFINNGDNFITEPNLDWAATNRVGGLNLNQQARVDILTASSDPFSVASGDVLLNLYQTKPGDPAVSGYTDIPANLTGLFQAHSGETLRLRFAEVDNVSFFNLGVDRVSITAVPEPSSWIVIGTGLLGLGLVSRLRRV